MMRSGFSTFWFGKAEDTNFDAVVGSISVGDEAEVGLPAGDDDDDDFKKEEKSAAVKPTEVPSNRQISEMTRRLEMCSKSS